MINNFGVISLLTIINLTLSILIAGHGIKNFKYLSSIDEKKLVFLMPTLFLIITTPSVVELIDTEIQWLNNTSSLITKMQLPILVIIFLICSVLIFKKYSKTEEELDNSNEIKNDYKNHFLSIIIFILFIVITTLLPYFYNGTYIDEYTHITSAKYLTGYGHLPEISDGTAYIRGIGFTLLVSFLFFILPESIYVAKLAPAIFGIGSFICLFFIGRILLKPKQLFFLLLIYSLSLGVILNHFYIRFYAMYEFFILLSSALFLYGFFTNKQRTKTSFLFFILFNTLIYLLSNDNGAYMIIGFNLVYYSLYLLKEYNFELKKLWRNIYKSKSRIVIFFSILLFILLTILFKFGFVDKIVAIFSYSNETLFPSNLWGYKKIFFTDTPILGLFVAIPLVQIIINIRKDSFLKKITSEEMLYLSFLAIFFIHLISSKDIQLFRGIFYLLPFFYLFAIYGISKVFKEFSIQFYVVSLSIVSLLAQYPANFFSNLTIPKESVYIGSELYSEVKSHCADALIISSQYPYVLEFYSISIDFFHQEKTDGYIGTGSLIIDEKGKIITSLTKTPTITTLQQFKEIISKPNKICYIERSPVVRVWLNEDTIKFIENDFKLVSSDINQRLFIKINDSKQEF